MGVTYIDLVSLGLFPGGQHGGQHGVQQGYARPVHGNFFLFFFFNWSSPRHLTSPPLALSDVPLCNRWQHARMLVHCVGGSLRCCCCCLTPSPPDARRTPLARCMRVRASPFSLCLRLRAPFLRLNHNIRACVDIAHSTPGCQCNPASDPWR